MRFLPLVFFITSQLPLIAQVESNNYVIVSIVKTTSSKLHPIARDYWLIDVEKWSLESDKEALIPLYLYGYSYSDLVECVKNDTLVLYNTTKSDSFYLPSSLKRAQNTLRSLLNTKVITAQRIKKKWQNGYKETIKVILIPVIGSFKFCFMKHIKGPNVPEYFRQVAIPYLGFEYNEDLFVSSEFKSILSYDFSTLDFLSLQSLRQ